MVHPGTEKMSEEITYNNGVICIQRREWKGLVTGKRYLTNYNTRISRLIVFLLLNEHIIIEAFYYVTITH